MALCSRALVSSLVPCGRLVPCPIPAMLACLPMRTYTLAEDDRFVDSNCRPIELVCFSLSTWLGESICSPGTAASVTRMQHPHHHSSRPVYPRLMAVVRQRTSFQVVGCGCCVPGRSKRERWPAREHRRACVLISGGHYCSRYCRVCSWQPLLHEQASSGKIVVCLFSKICCGLHW